MFYGVDQNGQMDSGLLVSPWRVVIETLVYWPVPLGENSVVHLLDSSHPWYRTDEFPEYSGEV